MSLSYIAARTIVRDCVHRARNREGHVNFTRSLEWNDVSSDSALDSLKSHILNNETIGVKSRGHTLKAIDLRRVSTSTTVSEVRKIVRDKSNPIPQ